MVPFECCFGKKEKQSNSGIPKADFKRAGLSMPCSLAMEEPNDFDVEGFIRPKVGASKKHMSKESKSRDDKGGSRKHASKPLTSFGIPASMSSSSRKQKASQNNYDDIKKRHATKSTSEKAPRPQTSIENNFPSINTMVTVQSAPPNHSHAGNEEGELSADDRSKFLSPDKEVALIGEMTRHNSGSCQRQSLLDALETSITHNAPFHYNEPPALSSNPEDFLYIQMHLPVFNDITPEYRLMDHFNYIVQEDSN
uniref:Uncharacterized protein n=1 Tax=Rhabditophanes sp. KR3021 TaxID=114890 RepID=A0AC35UG13_9BILA